MERCVGVGSSLLTWFLLFIIPSWGFPGARAQSIQHHDLMVQFNIWFLFVFKSFPASSRDTGRSIPFVGGKSLISTYCLFLLRTPTCLTAEVVLSSFSRLFSVHIHRFCNLSSCKYRFLECLVTTEIHFWYISLKYLNSLVYIISDLGTYSFRMIRSMKT